MSRRHSTGARLLPGCQYVLTGQGSSLLAQHSDELACCQQRSCRNTYAADPLHHHSAAAAATAKQQSDATAHHTKPADFENAVMLCDSCVVTSRSAPPHLPARHHHHPRHHHPRLHCPPCLASPAGQYFKPNQNWHQQPVKIQSHVTQLLCWQVT